MKIVCAPDKFRGSISAADAARAMAAGIRRVLPTAEIDVCPIADGGEGTVEALLAATSGTRMTSRVTGPSGTPVDAGWALLDDGTAAIEMAAAAGLDRVPEARRDPRKTTTFGVGELLIAALGSGAGRILLGLGGSGTVDGGCGMAQALGVRFRDGNGHWLPAPLTGGDVAKIRSIDTTALHPAVARTEIVGAADVDSPLTGESGAARVFGPQKGADPAAVDELEAALTRLAALFLDQLDRDVAALPGAGAAGGLGAGLLAFTDARLRPGIHLILERIEFDARVRGADLCLTGEGRLDGQSLAGKACLGVARAAAEHGVSTVALVGAAGDDADAALAAGLDEWRLIGPGLTAEDSIRRASELIAAAAAEVVRKRLVD